MDIYSLSVALPIFVLNCAILRVTAVVSAVLLGLVHVYSAYV